LKLSGSNVTGFTFGNSTVIGFICVNVFEIGFGAAPHPLNPITTALIKALVTIFFITCVP